MEANSFSPSILGHATEMLIKYPDSDNQGHSWRKIAVLMRVPWDFIGAIDLTKGGYKTFRFEKVADCLDADSGERYSLTDLKRLVAARAFRCDDQDQADVDIAAQLLSASMCEVMALKITAIAANHPNVSASQAIFNFVKRDLRSAVPGRYIPQGEKRRSWPIVLRAIEAMKPDRKLLLSCVKHVNANFHTIKRAQNFNSTLQWLVSEGAGVTPAIRDIMTEMNEA